MANSERSPLLAASTSTNNDNSESRTQALQKHERPISTLRGALICFSIWILIFILTSNVSLITTIQSSIASSLDVSSSVSWFTSAYLISSTSIMPVAGQLCTIFTPRVYLLSSIIIQVCGLLITSQAKSLAVFLVGRVVTGIGSAAVTPVAFILVTELSSPRRRGLLFGAINTGYTSGVACGAILAGALEPLVGWRAVFWLQIPFALCAVIVAFFAIPRPDDFAHTIDSLSLGKKLAQIDYFGVFSLVTSMVLLLYSFSSKQIQITPIILSFAALVLFVYVEANWATHPIVPISVLKSRGNILTGIATVGIMSARWGVLFYTPTYTLTVRNWSQASAGLTLIPTNLGFGSGGLLAGWLHIRRSGSFYVSCLVSMALFAASMFSVSYLSTPDSNIHTYVVALFLNGFLVGALLNYSLAHVLHLTLPQTHVIVIPLNAMFRGLSGSFGSSISGGFFMRTLQHTLKHGFKERGISGKDALIRQLLGTPILVQKLQGVDREVALFGYEVAIRNLYMAGGCLAIAMLLVQALVGFTAPEAFKEEESTDGNGRNATSDDRLSPVVSREPMVN